MSTTTLKLIALVLMLLDHIYEFIPGAPLILTILGRISAPVFFFCAVWGFHHTRSRRVYLLRMYDCSVLMGILDCLLNASVADPYRVCRNNIFSTLLVVCLFIYLWEMPEKPWKKAAMAAAFYVGNLTLRQMAVLLLRSPLVPAAQACFGWDRSACYVALRGLLPNLFTCEGGAWAVAMGIVLYFCKGSKKGLCLGYGTYCAVYLGRLLLAGTGVGIVGGEWMQLLFRDSVQWLQVLALPLMLAYNGQRGRNLKYLFYIFYPAHIAVLFYLGNYLAA